MNVNSHLPIKHSFSFFAIGLYFGILQISLYFTIQSFFTATFLGYFAVVLSWLIGVVFNLKFAYPKSLGLSLGLSLLAYYLLLLLAANIPPYYSLLPVYVGLIMVAALPAGAFFRELSQKFHARSLFFHENNGFVLGYVISLLGFVKWGVHFLYAAPLIAFIPAFLGSCGIEIVALLVLVVTSFIFGLMGGTGLFWCAVITGVVCILVWYMSPVLCSPEENDGWRRFGLAKDKETVLSKWQFKLVLFLSGCNLILIQYFITREFSSILAASEVSILIVGASYFFGYSVGYGLSRFFSVGMLRVVAVLMFFLHLLILVFVKGVAAYMIKAGYGFEVLIGLLIISSFLTSSFYSIFLPKLIEIQGKDSLVPSYIWDLMGAAMGVLVLFVLAGYFPFALWPLYFVLMLAIMALLNRKSPWVSSLLIVGTFIVVLFANYQQRIVVYGIEDYYHTRDYPNPKLLFTGHSFYHSTEIMDTFKDPEQTIPKKRVSFINGVKYFDFKYNEQGKFDSETSYSEFTYFLAELPAKYLYRQLGRKLKILILGGGSMYSINRVKDYSTKTTLVEIDPVVVKAAKAYLSEFNQYDKIDNYELVINDAKHFVMTTDEVFDLIVMDISAPYYLGTAVLHNRDFFRLVKKRLSPDGIFSESTQGRPYARRPNSQGMKILKAVVDVFPRYRVIDGRYHPRGKHGYVFASENFRFRTSELVAIMKEDGFLEGTIIYPENSPHFSRLKETIPFSMTNMETLLSGNKWRIESRLNIDDKWEDGEDLRKYKKSIARDRKELKELDFKLFQAFWRKLKSPSLWLLSGLVILVALLARFSHRYNLK